MSLLVLSREISCLTRGSSKSSRSLEVTQVWLQVASCQASRPSEAGKVLRLQQSNSLRRPLGWSMTTRDLVRSPPPRLPIQILSLRISQGSNRCLLSLHKSPKSRRQDERTCSILWKVKERHAQHVHNQEASDLIIPTLKWSVKVGKEPPSS